MIEWDWRGILNRREEEKIRAFLKEESVGPSLAALGSSFHHWGARYKNSLPCLYRQMFNYEGTDPIGSLYISISDWKLMGAVTGGQWSSINRRRPSSVGWRPAFRTIWSSLAGTTAWFFWCRTSQSNSSLRRRLQKRQLINVNVVMNWSVCWENQKLSFTVVK